jgi:uncharacterized membrane protein HdeD (DUF308 family)
MTSTHATSPPLAPPALLNALIDNWWLLLIRGIAAVIFGILAFAWPGLTLLTLILFWGAFAMVDGVIAVIAAIKGGVPGPRWWLAIVGACGIIVGILTFAMPGVTALVLLVFIAAWSIVIGIFQIVGAIRLRKEIENEWWLVAGGALSVLFGLALLVQPGTGALVLVWMIAIYAILFGILTVAFALRLRSHKDHAHAKA